MDKKYSNKLAKPNETIKEHTDKLISQAQNLKENNYIKDDKLFFDLLEACDTHDIGKANSQFQLRVKNHFRFDDNKEIPHNVLSLFFVDEGKCKNYISVCFAVLYHHYHINSPVDVFYENEELIKKFLKELYVDEDKYDDMYDCIDDIGDLFSLDESDLKKKYAVLLKGFLHKCDYSASAGIPCEFPNDFLIQCLQLWKNQNSVEYNDLQQFCLENSDKDIMITAPTGMGKTEAGLLWCGNNKCFFVLPLKTAINAMYDRIKSLSKEEYKNRVALIHSDMRSYYFNDNQESTSAEIDFDYLLRSRQMSLPVTVCTPDQIFDFVVKYPGYEYKLATASYSKFIIDEIQMYSPDILASIIYAVKMIHNYGGKFAILTATMPPFVKSELIKIFGDKIVQKDFSHEGKNRHNVKVYEKVLDCEDILECVKNTRSDKVKKYLVVCNSIDTANKIYNELSQGLSQDDIKVSLFHSKFIKRDRVKKEHQIMSAAKDTTKTEIWISTSVVEASLDIDFDILLTELSDLFSLFQRFGRVNRKGKKDFSDYNCFVFTELQGNAQRYKFTDETVYKYSKEAILTVDGIITEKTKNDLIEKYLSCENLKTSKYVQEYNSAYNYIQNLLEYENNTSKKLRNIDNIDVIPVSVYEENREEIENAVSALCDNSLNKTELFEANELLKNLTVSVSKYYNKNAVKSIRTKYLKIPILEYCTYSFEKGLEINK
ncbi:MAG: CRISPR-associated helicase Cas3' [Ruminococcus sp.]|nr:CRISPR-associated helicase Cas3' [Ruminococcus sp.]